MIDKEWEKHFKWVKSVIDSWPEWKRQCCKEALDNSSTRKTPRKPIINEDTDSGY